MVSVAEVKAAIDAMIAVFNEVQAHVNMVKEKVSDGRVQTAGILDQSNQEVSTIAVACFAAVELKLDDATGAISTGIENLQAAVSNM